MNTAADMSAELNDGASRAPRFMNFGTVAAIIRKDMRTLWPLAAGVFALVFVICGFFHDRRDFPALMLEFGSTQVHVDTALWLATSFGTPALAGLFIVMLVQQDRAVDPINDWMYRPIRASEIVMAKVLTVLGVVMAPATVGNAIYVIMDGGELLEFAGPICLIFMACAFLLLLGWLSSGPFQALLAALALGFLLAPIAFVGIRATQTFTQVTVQPAEAVVRIPLPPPVAQAAPARPSAVSVRRIEQAEGQRLDYLLLSVLAGLTAAGTGTVLWLLLGRRQVLAARLTFLGIYTTMALGFTMTIEVVDRTAPMPAPSTLQQRLASFVKNDANGDGKLDKAEYQIVLNELGYPDELENFWAQRERDGDGFLSMKEMEPEIGLTPPAASLQDRMDAFMDYDADNDRRLTKDEYALVLRSLGFGGQVEIYWPQRDTDKDGFISLEEYLPAVQAPAVEQPAPAPPR